ncbi:hypothetical protein ACQFX9_04695 [Aliinostoc sp. HNIBRCY26]|uniref:hypothetical protein n=1 Tax=Aliinostoc sp. HNIBRCY26 TaxID=3418997 RepID=UPI003D06CF1D
MKYLQVVMYWFTSSTTYCNQSMLQSLKKWLLIVLKIGTIATVVLLVIVGFGTLYNLASYKSKLGLFILRIPSAESIGQEYLQAVIQKNRDYIADDQECSHSALLGHITKYGGAEVRNTAIVADWHSGNGDHTFEITVIKFEYRYSQTASWKPGEIRLMTATNLERSNSLPDALPFRRIHCGGLCF